MRILTFKRLIGLAAVGGVAYVHKQRGGTWTMDSVQDTLRYLLSQAADKIGQMKEQAFQEAHASDKRPDRASYVSPGTARRIPEEAKPRSYGADLPKRDDTSRH